METDTKNRISSRQKVDSGQRQAPLDRPLLVVYLCYRLGITALLWALFFTNSSIGADYPDLFVGAALAYLSINVLLLAFVLKGWAPTHSTLLAIVLSDIFLLQLIGFASGPFDSGLGTLMVISVAAGAIFIRDAASLVPPAFATLTLFTGVGARLFDGAASDNEIVASGWLGLSFFVASLALNYLARRMRQSEARALHEASSARKLEELNQLIIARMQTGVFIANSRGKILASNRSALKIVPHNIDLLDFSLSDVNTNIASYHQRVHEHFAKTGSTDSPRARFSTALAVNGTEYRLTWVRLDSGNAEESLIFVEDLSRLAQQAQQLKLSSLGKLTASIAHEIRNPIGAASHAAQLLREEKKEDDTDRQLANIIVEQCKRCSNIISNIMDVSRGEPAKDALINLADWLPHFIGNYKNDELADITLHCPEYMVARFDPAHLEQIIRNLLDNAINAGEAKAGIKNAAIITWLEDDCAHIDIYDSGAGVSSENLPRLFEPFFTTGRTGSGLGLYICRELCTANQATISYVKNTEPDKKLVLSDNLSSHCFRIRFSHPERQSLNLANNEG
ncbi:MAG: ATP-binding protein [Pseudomonadales bacterium]